MPMTGDQSKGKDTVLKVKPDKIITAIVDASDRSMNDGGDATGVTMALRQGARDAGLVVGPSVCRIVVLAAEPLALRVVSQITQHLIDAADPDNDEYPGVAGRARNIGRGLVGAGILTEAMTASGAELVGAIDSFLGGRRWRACERQDDMRRLTTAAHLITAGIIHANPN